MIVKRDDLCAVWQLQAGDLGLDLLDDLLTILSAQDDDHAGNSFALPVAHHSAVARQSVGFYVRDLLKQHGDAIGSGHDDVSKVVDALRPTQPTHGVLLLRMFDIAAAEVGVVVRDGCYHIVKGEVEAAQIVRVDLGRVLLGLATPGIDFAYAGDRKQRVTDYPVMQCPAIVPRCEVCCSSMATWPATESVRGVRCTRT